MTYQIADEPIETSLSAYVVRPSVPLLAACTAGAWLAWPWFAFNAIAIGSPTRRKELALCGVAVVGTAALAMLVIALAHAGLLPGTAAQRLALLGITAFKLTMSYWISSVQERTFHVYEYYGGRVRNATRILSAAYLVRGVVIGLVDDPLWVIIVASGL